MNQIGHPFELVHKRRLLSRTTVGSFSQQRYVWLQLIVMKHPKVNEIGYTANWWTRRDNSITIISFHTLKFCLAQDHNNRAPSNEENRFFFELVSETSLLTLAVFHSSFLFLSPSPSPPSLSLSLFQFSYSIWIVYSLFSEKAIFQRLTFNYRPNQQKLIAWSLSTS